MVLKNDQRFYMISYLVYLLATRTIDYLGLFKRGDLQDVEE